MNLMKNYGVIILIILYGETIMNNLKEEIVFYF